MDLDDCDNILDKLDDEENYFKFKRGTHSMLIENKLHSQKN